LFSKGHSFDIATLNSITLIYPKGEIMEDPKQILLIEDNKSFRLLLSHFLSKNYDVVTKANGISAVQWLNEQNFPDLILLDLEMPEMSGEDFLFGLQSSGFHKEIPVIIISGNNRNLFEVNNPFGFQHYFEKPFDPIKLLEKIEQIFASDKIHMTP
jgi:CheY-like chemotaxis protein